MKFHRTDNDYLEFLEGCYHNPVVFLELSSICNFQCDYCVSKENLRKKTFMSQELFEKLALQVKELTPYHLRLHIDGEPTLHPQFKEFGKFLNDNDIPFVLATNGSTLNQSLLELKMDVRLSISTNPVEFSRRTPNLNYKTYIAGIVDYLDAWLHSDSQQAIYIQISYNKHSNIFSQLFYKEKLVFELISRLSLRTQTKKIKTAGGTGIKYQYHKKNGGFLCFYTWNVNKSQVYCAPSANDLKTDNGFCSAAWQELAVLADGRVSFCCQDLTGSTAYAADANVRSLKDIWSDKAIISVRRAFMENRAVLPVCKRCLASYPENSCYLQDHPYDAKLIKKSVDDFPFDSLGNVRT